MFLLQAIRQCISDDITNKISTTRVGFFIALFSLIVFTAFDVHYNHKFNGLEFCGAVAALNLGVGLVKKASN